VTVILVGMLVCVLAAVAVLALVAVPRVREGEKLLTPDGEAAVRDAGRRARELAVEARDKAVQAVQQRRDDSTGQDDVAAPAEPAAAQPAEPAAAQPAEPAAAQPVEPQPVEPEPAEEPVPPEPARVIDLRDAPGDDASGKDEPVGEAAQRPAGGPAVDAALARSLEWGDPELGPRHRR
jgi:cytoskeletal protein RodZ